MKESCREKGLCYDFKAAQGREAPARDESILKLVRFLARRAAENDYAAQLSAANAGGGSKSRTTTKDD